MKTTLILTIEHKKPLPEGATDIVAQRFYGWAYSRGVEVGVTAEVVAPDASARCLGHGAGPSGHQHRMDCQNCARRLAPRAGDVPWIEPAQEFPCPNRIPEAPHE